jgi:hypothetical protein
MLKKLFSHFSMSGTGFKFFMCPEREMITILLTCSAGKEQAELPA